MFEYDPIASVVNGLRNALSALLDAFEGYGAEVLRFALDNPLAFVLSVSALVGLMFYARAR